MQWLRSLAAFVALAVALLLWADDAEARLEGGPSVGRSAQGTLQAPPVAAPALAVIAANDHLPVGSSSYPGGSLGGLFNRPGADRWICRGLSRRRRARLAVRSRFCRRAWQRGVDLRPRLSTRAHRAIVPADLEVVEWPQCAGLCRPVAAAIGRSLSALAPRISSRHRGAAQRGRCRRRQSSGRQQVVLAVIAAPASRDMRPAHRQCCCAAKSAHRIWCRHRASGRSRAGRGAAAWRCRNGLGHPARSTT